MFNPKRFAFARRRRGMTKRALADKTGASTRAITAYEAGERTPLPEILAQLAKLLEFPLEFFYGDDLDEFTEDSASFRSLSQMTAGQRDSALAAGTLAVRLGRWIEERFQLPECTVPDFHEGGEPEGTAAGLRAAWGLGERPIGNMIHLLEVRGIRVFSLAEDCHEVDAFSLWDGKTPYILLNTKKTPERSRFDAAHELGHLTLHRHGSMTGRKAEEQANAFASAFLMPETAVKARTPRSPSLRSIMECKETWGVSAVAFCFRLHKLGMLTDWYYQQLMRKLSALGYRTTEKHSRTRETSQVLRKVFDELRASGVTKGEVARLLEIDSTELDRLVFSLVMTGLTGGGDDSASSGERKHNLRLV
jgi:Zn-dependent peptidase ImmA (M78 family)/transcriptional regulator with XRE-family HTH domain